MSGNVAAISLPMSTPFSLFLVEDHTLTRESLSVLFRGEPHVELIGVAGSAEEALAMLRQRQPDIALLDLGLPGKSGIDLTRDIKRRWPEVEVMAHTVFEDRRTVLDVIRAGAASYMLKGSTPRELLEALNDLRAGGAPMSPKIARSVIRELQGDEAVEEAYLLTSREKEVLRGIERGLSYKELAAELNISRHTVHSHIKKIYERLHARDKRDALSKARRKGLL